MIENRSIRIVAGTLLFILAALLDGFLEIADYRLYVYLVPYLVSGHVVLRRAVENFFKGRFFDEFSLMSLATIGAFVIGEYPEGVFVMLFYEIGEFAQHRAVNKARDQIHSLVDKRPDKAIVQKDGDWQEMPAKNVNKGTTILVKKGERVPIDGILKDNEAVFNTASITGESLPREHEKGDEIPSGFLNEGPPIQIETTADYENSTFSRIIRLTQEAAGRKAPTETFFRKFARVYTPIVVFLALALFLLPALFIENYQWQTWLYRACVFLVISCPCALILSIPLTYFAGIGAAGNAGILTKGSVYLDQLTRLSGLVFDKTGTLTKGELKVEKFQPLPDDELLAAIKSLTDQSTHPASKAVSKHLHDKESKEVNDIEEQTGKGVKGIFKGNEIKLGSPKWVDESYKIDSNAHTTLLAAYNGEVICSIQLSDEIKEDASEVLKYLKKKNINTYLLSGDISNIVDAYASQFDFTDSRGEAGPEEKLEIYRKWQSAESGSLAFAGDGINDSIVMAASDLGIAMGGSGSDVAIESADIVIPGDRLSHIPEALLIAGNTRKILWQNIILVFAVKVLVLGLGGAGFVSLWMAILADVGIALVAVLNASRLIYFKPKWGEES